MLPNNQKFKKKRNFGNKKLNFSSIIEIFVKKRNLCQKFEIFAENLKFWRKLKILRKIRNFGENPKFWETFEIFTQKSYFSIKIGSFVKQKKQDLGENSKFLTKIQNFGKHSKFSPKNLIFRKKVEILVKNRYFWAKTEIYHR